MERIADATIVNLLPVAKSKAELFFSRLPLKARQWMDFDNFESAAQTAIITASKSFDPKRGSFRNWAICKIRIALNQELIDHGWFTRAGYRNGAYMHYLDNMPEADTLPVEERGARAGVEFGWRRALLDGACDALLNPTERLCFSLYFVDGEEMGSISAITGLKQWYVSNVLSRTLAKLRCHFTENGDSKNEPLRASSFGPGALVS